MYQRVIGTCPVSPAIAILSFESKARILLYRTVPYRVWQDEDTGLTWRNPRRWQKKLTENYRSDLFVIYFFSYIVKFNRDSRFEGNL